ncbi:hypothetical protein [Corynebacterium sp. H78]|uniref:hypothetical protein n=1 Tax=Corynebacterium sp. H78 TaxID=3133417 RepID=UPI0030B1CA17
MDSLIPQEGPRARARTLVTAFSIVFLLALVWELIGQFLLPDANLAYTSGVIVWSLTIIIPALIVGLATHLLGWPYVRVWRWTLILVGALACVVLQTALMVYVFATTPPDGQDGLIVAYVVFVHPMLILVGSWITVLIADFARGLGRHKQNSSQALSLKPAPTHHGD